MVYSFANLLFIIASFCFAVAALLVIAGEADVVGLSALEWFVVGTPFFGLAHWIPGNLRG